MPKTQKQLVPYLTVSDGAKAVAFYKKGMGAKEVMRMPTENGKGLMHAELEVNGHSLYLSDDLMGNRAPEKIGGTPVAIFVQLAAPKEVDQWMGRAAKAGATITMPAADQFWGDRFGMLNDPFGHAWSFGAPLPKPKKAPAKMPKKK